MQGLKIRGMDDAAIDLPADELRRIGHVIVDAVVDRAQRLRDEPVAVRASRRDPRRDGAGLVRRRPRTEVAGRTVPRLCTINPRTTVADVDATLEELTRLAGGRT